MNPSSDNMNQDWNTITFKKDTTKLNKNPPKKSPKEYKIVNKDLASSLQQARCAKNETQKSLAAKLNILSADLNSWERGLTLPSNDVIAKLSNALGIKLPRNQKIPLEELE